MENNTKLSWEHLDIECRCGFRSKKFTAVNFVFTFIFGTLLTVLFFAVLFPFRGSSTYIDMFFHGGVENRSVIPYFTMLLAFWAVAILLVKLQKLGVQRRALALKILPRNQNFVLSPATAKEILDNIYKEVQTPKRFLILDRIERSLSNLKDYYIDVVYRVAPEYDDLIDFADYFTNVVHRMPGTSDFSSETYSDYVLSQYDVIEGTFPQNENEIVLVVGQNNQVSDLTLAQLGLLNEKKFAALFLNGTDDAEAVDDILDESLVDFSEIIGKEYTLFYNDAVYNENEDYVPPTMTAAIASISYPLPAFA